MQLTQILANLLTNAARYTAPEGRIELSTERVDERVEFRVRDNGRGIPPEAFERIFEPFERPDGVRAGLGLGLALVRQLTELHGGRVSGYSAGPGRGSEFVVSLPCAGKEDSPGTSG